MPGPINLGGDAAADFAASLVSAAGGAATEGTNDDGSTDEQDSGSDRSPDDESLSAPDAADSSDELDPEAGADAADAGDDEDGDDDSDGSGDSAALAQELGQLLIDNPAEFFKRTGVDPKVLKINGPKFEAMRKGLKEAKELRAAAEAAAAANQAEDTRLKAVLADAKKSYGPLVDLKNSLALGDYGAAKELLEALAPKGTTYQQIAEGIVKAAQNVSPSEAALRRQLKQEREERAAAEEKARKEREETESKTQGEALAKKNLAGATAKLKGTAFEGVDGAAEKLVQIVASNWDYERKGLKIPIKDCLKLLAKDPVVSKLVELKKLKGTLPPTAPRTQPRDESSQRFKKRETPKLDAKAKAEQERKAAMAEASRLEAQAQRGARRRAR
jgi:hypothetical protein